MDLRESLELIQQTAQEAKQAKPVRLVSNPHTQRLLMPDGRIDTLGYDLPPRRHVVYDIDSLAILAEGKAHVWHDNTQVVAVLDDDAHRENTVTMPLPEHPTFIAAAALEKKEPLEQKELLDYLRQRLKLEIERAFPGFIEGLRKIKIQQNTAGFSNLQHGRENMGREIDNAVSGADALPDELIVVLPLWLHLDFLSALTFLFDIDVAKGKFKLWPKPGQVEQHRVAGQKWLHGELETACDGAVIYFGQPGPTAVAINAGDTFNFDDSDRLNQPTNEPRRALSAAWEK